MLRALLLMCLMTMAQGQTLLVGVSKFDRQNDGVWYQESFPHQLNMQSGSIGLRFDSKQVNGWSHSAGYMSLGRVSSSAIATASDANYNPASPTGCNGPCWPLSHWYGDGSVQGVFGTAVKHFGPWAIEAGLYLYQPTWKVHIPDWIQCRTCTPIDLRVEHNARWQLGPMIGGRWQATKDFSLNLSAWQTQSQGDDWSSLYHRITINFSAGYTF